MRGKMPELTIYRDQEEIGCKEIYTEEVVLGSALEGTGILLDAPGVAPHHAKITYNGKDYSIVDLKTESGTFVNDEKILYKNLVEGDVIRIGPFRLHFHAPPETRIVAELDPREPEIPSKASDRERLTLLYQICETIDLIYDPEKLLDKSAELLAGTFDADTTFIGLLHMDGERFDLTVEKAKEKPCPPSSTLIEWVKRNEKAFLTSDATDDKRLKKARSVMMHQIHSTMCAPLFDAGGMMMGIVYLDHRSLSMKFTEEDLRFLVSICKLLSSAITQARRHQHVVSENAALRQKSGRIELIGESPKIKALKREIEIFASRGDSHILLTGETGSGKEMAARMIHQHSRRADKPFITLNCSAIPESMIESELFGFEKWAFTDAKKARRGKFELADGGTLFLDEIGDMSLSAQAKILRAIETGEIQRIGSEEEMHADVRIISATHKDLFEEVRKGNFREDLYYRLCTVEIKIPPLRERREDIELLVKYFIERFKHEIHTNVETISPEALEILRHHDWPGNVRELRQCIERALYCPSGKVLLPEHLPPLRRSREQSEEAPPLPPSTPEGRPPQLKEIIEAAEKRHIEKILRQCGGKKSEAARILNISRYTLDRKIALYDIEL
ncbi:MAG: FHA domain-containing protein [Deltaproteobacteria bacterium]|nr:MAG: FHA domain-containing protein [Deltaproteobacteria bacterium]